MPARRAGMSVFPCADGQIFFMAGGVASNRLWAGSVKSLMDEGAPGAQQLLEPRWLDNAFLATDEARRLPICPTSTPADLTDNRQLCHRGHFTPLTPGAM